MQGSDKLQGSEGTSGIIFNIQRFSIHDGAGIRTLLFMKGCPLRCKWCSNPEGQKSHPELEFLSVKCVGTEKCNAPCSKVCPVEAITLSEEGKPNTDRGICRNCGKCAEACYYGARTIVGKSMTVEEVLAEVERDKPFYRNSGGGVTVGGGEPLMQSEFVTKFLKKCHERFISTAIETNGYVSWESLKGILEYVDLIYYDVKHMDPLRHKELTGVTNDLILRNAKRIFTSTMDSQIIIRVPILPGCNDSKENIEATIRFVAESGGKMIELLPYHKFGISKYSQYGLQYELNEIESPTKEDMQRLRKIVKSHGLKEMTGIL